MDGDPNGSQCSRQSPQQSPPHQCSADACQTTPAKITQYSCTQRKESPQQPRPKEMPPVYSLPKEASSARGPCSRSPEHSKSNLESLGRTLEVTSLLLGFPERFPDNSQVISSNSTVPSEFQHKLRVLAGRSPEDINCDIFRVYVELYMEVETCWPWKTLLERSQGFAVPIYLLQLLMWVCSILLTSWKCLHGRFHYLKIDLVIPKTRFVQFFSYSWYKKRCMGLAFF